jgi:hypothetical protein
MDEHRLIFGGRGFRFDLGDAIGMSASILVPVIYLAFISLGLPDSVLGVAWPSMRLALGAPLEAAGLLASSTTLEIVAPCVTVFIVLLIVLGEILNRRT